MKKYSLLLICFFVEINFANAANTTLKVLIPAPLVLSVKNTALNSSLTGITRSIVIINTGSSEALNIAVTPVRLPIGTIVENGCKAPLKLKPQKMCVIKITPGQIATSTLVPGQIASACTNGSAPTPGGVSIKATNSMAVTRQIVVLGYGCIYKGGFVYALNDIANSALNVQGKVLSLETLKSPTSGVNFSQAQILCANRTYASFDDWRTPTICEMAADASEFMGFNLPVSCTSNKQQMVTTLSPLLIGDPGSLQPGTSCPRGHIV